MNTKLTYSQLEQRVKELEERLDAEEKVNESSGVDETFQRFFNCCPMGIFLYELLEDGNLIFQNSNKAADDILGVDCTQFVGCTIEEAFPVLMDTEIPMRYREAASQGISWESEQVDYRHGEINGVFKVVAFQTKANEMACMFEDKTEQISARKALENSREMLKSVFDHVYDAIFIHDTEGNIIDINQKVLYLYGLTREQILPLTIADISSPDSPMDKAADYWQRVVSGQNLFFEWKGFRPLEGTEFDVEVFLSRISIDNEYYILANVRDITERKQAGQALIDSETRYRMMFEHAGFGITLIDTETLEVVECNKETYESLGYTREEFIRSRSTKINRKDEEIQGRMKRTIEKGPDLYIRKDRKKNGDIRDRLISSVPIKIGEKYFLHDISVDITDHKRTQRELNKALKELSEMNETLELEVRRRTEELVENKKQLVEAEGVAMLGRISNRVAHELRNPLTIVGGFIRRLHERMPDDDQNKEYIDIAFEQAKVLENKISEIIKIDIP